jgi:3-oxoacyl-[acyl-carrier protein] reductase
VRDVRHVTKAFTISREMVDRFADLTGDRNAAHIDEEFARKLRYRAPMAHGMLALSFIVCLEDIFPDSRITYTSLDVRFRAPIPFDTTVRLQAGVSERDDGLEFRAHWMGEPEGDTLIEASGRCRLDSPLSDPVARAGHRTCLLTEEVSENAYVIGELEGRSETVWFCLEPAVLSRFQAALFRQALGRDNYWFCPNLAALLLVSPLVGMRLPGRYATLGAVKVSFERSFAPGAQGSLVGTVARVSRASEYIDLSISFAENGETIGSGQVKAVVNPVPRQMMDCETIKTRYLEMGLRGKVAVITGASRGIGETAAKLFAMHGVRTVVHYHRGERDAKAITEDIESAGGTALALGCDIRDNLQVARLFAEVLDAYGRVDILVNNAVKEFRPCDFLKLRWKDYLDELEVSLKGMHNCCREVVPIFRRQGAGKIVNLSSVIVDSPVAGHNQYITAKSAVVGYTRSLAKELMRDNIQANLVVPAMTETDLLSWIPTEFVTRIGNEREFGRNVRPIEVAFSILYLSSSWSDAISGQQIVLNLGEPPFA